MAPLARSWDAIVGDVLGPLRLPGHPRETLRFGLHAIRSASALARRTFRGEAARALLGGISAHSGLPLERSPSAAFGLLLGLTGHALGWPIPRGGSQKIADAMLSRLRRLGGDVITRSRVSEMEELPEARVYLFDVSPRALARIAPERLPARYLRRLERYRYGPGVFKIDYALDAPLAWSAPACDEAGTVHLGGTLEDLESALRAPWLGAHPERPLVILAQPSLFDPTRAPAGKHTLWAYCHVPAGSTDGAPLPLRDARSADLPLLFGDPSWRRSARHVRLLRGAGGAALSGAESLLGSADRAEERARHLQHLIVEHDQEVDVVEGRTFEKMLAATALGLVLVEQRERLP